MKRLLCVLLCLCVLTACGAKESAPQAPAAESSSVEAAPPAKKAPAVEEAPIAEEPPTVEEAPTVVEPPVVEEAPTAEEPPAVAAAPSADPVCRLSIHCGAALGHPELEPALLPYLPESGRILPETAVPFTPGESVFDVLLRTVRRQGIHMEFVDTAVYGSAYIEGIGGLYEFACGSESGWIYTVDGVSPNVGCSSYIVEDGDVIVWEYVTERV